MFRAADKSTPIHRNEIAVLPEAGALCSNSASTDLCGGRRVTVVPTATLAFCLCLTGGKLRSAESWFDCQHGADTFFQRLKLFIYDGGYR